MKGKSGRRDFRPKKQLGKRVKDNTLWDDKEGKALFFGYFAGLIVLLLLMVIFGEISDDSGHEGLYKLLSEFFRILGLTFGLFYYLIFATIKAVRGGYFEPVNYLAWLLVAGIWWLAV